MLNHTTASNDKPADLFSRLAQRSTFSSPSDAAGTTAPASKTSSSQDPATPRTLVDLTTPPAAAPADSAPSDPAPAPPKKMKPSVLHPPTRLEASRAEHAVFSELRQKQAKEQAAAFAAARKEAAELQKQRYLARKQKELEEEKKREEEARVQKEKSDQALRLARIQIEQVLEARRRKKERMMGCDAEDGIGAEKRGNGGAPVVAERKVLLKVGDMVSREQELLNRLRGQTAVEKVEAANAAETAPAEGGWQKGLLDRSAIEQLETEHQVHERLGHKDQKHQNVDTQQREEDERIQKQREDARERLIREQQERIHREYAEHDRQQREEEQRQAEQREQAKRAEQERQQEKTKALREEKQRQEQQRLLQKRREQELKGTFLRARAAYSENSAPSRLDDERDSKARRAREFERAAKDEEQRYLAEIAAQKAKRDGADKDKVAAELLATRLKSEMEEKKKMERLLKEQEVAAQKLKEEMREDREKREMEAPLETAVQMKARQKVAAWNAGMGALVNVQASPSESSIQSSPRTQSPPLMQSPPPLVYSPVQSPLSPRTEQRVETPSPFPPTQSFAMRSPPSDFSPMQSPPPPRTGRQMEAASPFPSMQSFAMQSSPSAFSPMQSPPPQRTARRVDPFMEQKQREAEEKAKQVVEAQKILAEKKKKAVQLQQKLKAHLLQMQKEEEELEKTQADIYKDTLGESVRFKYRHSDYHSGQASKTLGPAAVAGVQRPPDSEAAARRMKTLVADMKESRLMEENSAFLPSERPISTLSQKNIVADYPRATEDTPSFAAAQSQYNYMRAETRRRREELNEDSPFEAESNEEVAKDDPSGSSSSSSDKEWLYNGFDRRNPHNRGESPPMSEFNNRQRLKVLKKRSKSMEYHGSLEWQEEQVKKLETAWAKGVGGHEMGWAWERCVRDTERVDEFYRNRAETRGGRARGRSRVREEVADGKENGWDARQRILAQEARERLYERPTAGQTYAQNVVQHMTSEAWGDGMGEPLQPVLKRVRPGSVPPPGTMPELRSDCLLVCVCGRCPAY